ncbi:HEAT repeat domain-containing protein [Candidatus Poribacteria bacterium]|nr:HEAT repeat domain-containing protein [Candidatus Poribacteria bacterium]
MLNIMNKLLCIIIFLSFTMIVSVQFSYAASEEIIDLIKDLGNKDKSSQAIEKLVEKKDTALIPELFLSLSGDNALIRKNSSLVLERIGKSAINALSQILKNPEVNNSTKDNVVNILGKIQDTAVIPALMEVLSMDNPYLRNNAVKLLKTKGDAVIPYLQDILSQNINFRSSISDILVNLNNPEAIKKLFLLFDDKEIEVRRSVVYAISKSNLKEFVAPLAKKVLDEKEDIDVLRGAATALRNIGNTEAFIALIDIFRAPDAIRPNCSCDHDVKPIVPIPNKEFPVYVKEEILKGEILVNNYDELLKIAKNEKENIQIRYLMLDFIDEMRSVKIVPFFIESFKFDTKFRIMSIYSIIKVGNAAHPLLFDYIKKDESGEYIGTLGQIFEKSRNYSENMKAFYEKEGAEVKKRILKILVAANNMDLLADISVKAKSEERRFIADTIREDGADGYFINIMLIKDQELTLLAFENLAKLKSERSIPSMLKFLDNEDKELIDGASSAIKNIVKKEKAELYIKDYLNQKQPQKTITFFENILIDFGPSIAPVLIKKITDKDDKIKQEVTGILIKLGAKTAPELIQAITSKDKDISRACIEILKQMNHEVVPYIIQALDSPDTKVMIIARDIVNKEGDKSIPYLLKGLEDDKTVIRVACAELLAEKKHPAAISVLMELITDSNKTFQIKAIFALTKYGDKVIDSLYKEWEKQNFSSRFKNSIFALFGVEKRLIKDSDLVIFNKNIAKIFSTIGASSVDKLIIMVEKYTNDERKTEILQYLEIMKNPKTPPLFLKNLNNKNVDIVMISIKGLESLKIKEAEEPLKDIIKNTNNQKLKQRAILALKEITNQ